MTPRSSIKLSQGLCFSPAQGRPCVGLHLYAAVQPLVAQPSHSGPWVPAGTRSSLRPLTEEGVRDEAKLGRAKPRGREAVSATRIIFRGGPVPARRQQTPPIYECRFIAAENS